MTAMMMMMKKWDETLLCQSLFLKNTDDALSDAD